MAIQFVNPITAGTVLVRSDVRSQNYAAGSAGWIIEADGSAEFNDVTIRGGTVVSGTALYYNGSPGAGNLILSIAAQAGTDSYGNAYQAGLTSYTPTTSINMYGDDVTLTASNGTVAQLESGINAGLYLTPSGGPWFTGQVGSTIGGGSHPGLELLSPSDETHGIASFIILEGSSTTSTQTSILSASDFWAHTGDLRVFGKGQIQNYWVKQDGSGNAYTWQTPSYAANWAGSTTFNGSTNWHTLQYRIDAEDNLWLVGGFKATGAVGNTLFTLPSGYRPTGQWPVFCQQNNAGTVSVVVMEIGSSGNVNLLSQNGMVAASGNEYLVNGKIPLGNIS
jgi:hypothetical protein